MCLYLFLLLHLLVILPWVVKYCKSGNFRENFIFANSIKIHICDAKHSRLGRDLRILVNDRVISAFREDFAKFREIFRIYSNV